MSVRRDETFANIIERIRKLEAIEIPLINALYATAGVSTTLVTGFYSDIPNTTIVLSPGTWLVTGNFCFVVNSGDNGQTVQGLLRVGGVIGGAPQVIVTVNTPGDAYVMGSNAWIVTVNTDTAVNLVGYKSGGSGNSRVVADHTSIEARGKA